MHKTILEALGNFSLSSCTKEILPTKYFTQHKANESKLPLIFRIPYAIIVLHMLLAREFIKALSIKKFDHIKPTELMIYVPNVKYEKFLSAISKYIKSDYIVVTTSDVSKNYANLKKIVIKESIIISLQTYFIITKYLLITSLRQHKETINIIYEINSVYKMIYYSMILDKIIIALKVKRFFSLLPSGDFHNIITRLTQVDTLLTLSIRPDTTSFAEAHNYFKTDILFYKNDFEKIVYESYDLNKNCKLLQGGILISETNFDKQSFNNILFIDTCLNKWEESKKRRSKTILTTYDLILQNNNYNFIHRFHPALDKNEKLKTLEFLKHNSIKVDNSNENNLFNNIGLVISFYSTILFTCCLNSIPLVVLDGDFAVANYLGLDIYESPILILKNEAELSSFILNYFACECYEDILKLCKTNEVRKWFIDYYNYPSGIINIARYLNDEA